MHNIQDFGAIGDGKTVNTQAIQQAIDAGGTVYIPDGVYVTGTLYLKSNGGLYLSPGATLVASHNHEDYNAADYCPQNQIFQDEFMAGTHLITAVEQENVFIAGYGTIYGDSHHWVNESRKSSYCDFWGHPAAEAQRPAQMIFFAECRNIRVENINLRYAPFWHLFFHGCTDVMVNAVNIQGERRQWVNDGIDIDCCSNVTISNCIIDTGDDGITLRANGMPLVNRDHVCENVVISNCTITSYLDYGIRIGVGDGIIRNCLFSNIVIKDSLSGLGMTCRFSPQGYCTSIENLQFSNMIIDARRALELKISNVQSHPALKNDGFIRNITFNNLTANTNRCCYILGFQDTPCSNITFQHCKFTFTPQPQDERCKCEYSDVERGSYKVEQEHYNDCALFVYKAKDISFHHLTVEKNNCIHHDVLAEQTEHLTIT